MTTEYSRRTFLRTGAVAGGLGAGGQRLTRPVRAHTASAAGANLTDIGHIVILIQENRSFDHYFGTYKGVRGFDDRSAPRAAAAFSQRHTAPATSGLPNPMVPFHINTSVGAHQGVCTNDVEHQWAGQHDSWHGGANDRWMESHLATEPDPKQAAITMSYYTRQDLPFYYQLADNFTICDNYFCSVIAGTDVNRLYSMTGTIDPDGWDGGDTFLNTKVANRMNLGPALGAGRRWVPYPEVLQRSGISWKIYGTPDGQYGDNVLGYFPQFRLAGGDPTLSAPAFSSNLFPADFAADCLSGSLPQVSWLLASLVDTEHAPDPITWGESITHTVIEALANSPAWASCALFVTYDENGGFFDHVPPPTPPRGTAGEYLSQKALTTGARAEATTTKGIDLSAGPIGLGFRVPMLVVSPFTRNPQPAGAPLVCSDTFDHTSILRFIETWSLAIGKPARIPRRNEATRSPGLSAWRASRVGDLTSAFNFAATPDRSVPSALLANIPNRADPKVLSECIASGTVGSLATQTQPIVQDPVIPSPIGAARQETFAGSVRRPSGIARATTPPTRPTPAAPPTGPPAPAGRALPKTGAVSSLERAVGVVALAGVVIASWRKRRLDDGNA